MTLPALPSAIHLIARAAQEFLDANASQDDVAWIVVAAMALEALRRSNGNQCQAARILGVHRNTLRRHLHKVALFPFVGDVKKYVDTQLKLFGGRRLAKSCTDAHSLSTPHPKFLQRISARAS